MGRLEKLSDLNLGNNKRIKKLPDCIEEMKSLTSLDVGGCDLDCLPQGMGRLDKYSHLDLNNNMTIVTLQKCIEKMKSLRCLDVGGCDLDCLAQGIV
jgi:Leucine-rich repeat (LRR) protein